MRRRLFNVSRSTLADRIAHRRGANEMMPRMNRNLALLTFCQGLFLTNNVTFIAINGLVGLALAPEAWMATLPVTACVVGARSQRCRWRGCRPVSAASVVSRSGS